MKAIYPLIISFSFLLNGCSLCENEIYKSYLSPSKEYSAVVFNRSCGATTGFSTQVSITKFKNELGNEGGNTLVMKNHPKDTNITLKWVSENELLISDLGKNYIYKQKKTFGSILVNYE